MAAYKDLPDGKCQVTIRNKLLPKPHYTTWPSRAEGEAYAVLLEAKLKKGEVPPELLAPRAAVSKVSDSQCFSAVIMRYLREGTPSNHDLAMGAYVAPTLGTLRMDQITHTWVLNYVSDCKTKLHLAPGSIRQRIGFFGRVVDWYYKSVDDAPANPFRNLPKGYSAYGARESRILAAENKEVKVDVHRNRRLTSLESARILKALSGEKDLGEGIKRFKPLDGNLHFKLLVLLILNTGVRLFEAYRTRKRDIDLAARLYHVQGSKGHRGKIKHRLVPLNREITDALQDFVVGNPDDLLFPFWDGTEAGRAKTKSFFARRFKVLFEFAGIDDFHEHDLRHEATCRWFTYRTKAGGWMYQESELCKILGWSDPRMVLRYLSLRGEDLVRFED